MRRLAVKTLALALVLGGAGIGLAQQQPGQPGQPPGQPRQPGMPPEGMPGKKTSPEKSKLEGMLAEALKNNPEIRVAAANLTLAEAELYRTRLQVTQKVLTLYHAIQSQQATVDFEQKQYDRMQGLLKDRAIDSRLVEERFTKLTAAKAKLAELEAQMPALLGKTAQAEYYQTIQEAKLLRQEAIRSSIQTRRAMIEEAEWEQAHKPTGPMAERIRKALEKPISINLKDAPVTQAVDDIASTSGLAIKFVKASGVASPDKVSMHLENVPLRAALQCLEDSLVYYRIVVRDYGLLITHEQYIPPGAMTLSEFMRQKPADEPRRQPTSGKNPPAKNVSGRVKAVDASGLITISIGSDAGLAKGHTLELSRMAKNPPHDTTRHLGTIRILEVQAKEAVGQAVGHLADKPKVGDCVTNAPILGN